MEPLQTIVVLTGDWQHVDFYEFTRHWDGLVNHVAFDELEDFLAGSSFAVSTIIIAAARPGRFSSAAIERIHSAVPLARITVLLGSWSEGETRTGHPWPGIPRVYWHQLPSIHRDPHSGLDHLIDLARVPRTYSAADISMSEDKQWNIGSGELIGIRSPEFMAYDAIADLVADLGYTHLCLNAALTDESPRMSAIVIDLGMDRTADMNLVESIRNKLPQVPIIALMNYPRRSDWLNLSEAGATCILSKPYRIVDFADIMQSCLANA